MRLSPLDHETAQCLNGMAAGLEEGLVAARIFNDERIHRAELERVFGRAWTFMAHESEIPAPGDYVLRYIGTDPFIVVRDEGGTVRVLFDACRHRGAQVCRAERGNASHFRCSYHGWTYKNTGEMIGAPSFRDAYPNLDRSRWGLIAAAKVDQVHGFIFATLDPDAPDLDDYLGGMRWYLDLMFAINRSGLEVVGEPQRWNMRSDWKSGADNFSGDDYHTLFLHKSMGEIGAIPIDARANMTGYHIQAGNGHCLSFSIAESAEDGGPTFWGFPAGIVETFDASAVSPKQFDIARRSRVAVGNIFPNLSFLLSPLTVKPRTVEPVTVFTIRQWQPRGPGRTEAWVWFLTWKDAPQADRAKVYQAGIGTFSAGGIFEQDDAEPWQSIARGARSTVARTHDLQLNYQMGLGASPSARFEPEWPGPGVAFRPRYEEGVQRALYRRWLDYMESEVYPAPRPASPPLAAEARTARAHA